jgi:hypothetical protein
MRGGAKFVRKAITACLGIPTAELLWYRANLAMMSGRALTALLRQTRIKEGVNDQDLLSSHRR